MEKFFGQEIGKLGFGLMRLPRIVGSDEIDVEQTKVMVDRFMAAGLNYFDTAFVYQGSEVATKKALIDRYPREDYYLASKLHAGFVNNAEDAKKELFTSLERTGAQYFDFYLLHAFMESNYHLYDTYGLWDYVREMKEQGYIRHYGFSAHCSPELLDKVLTEHPDAEFVQLQINYADWENPSVASRACYEVARKHNKPIIVMEPVKGGTLANPPEAIQNILRAADPAASPASWAIRYAASKEGVMTVLSGMSNIEQVEDNLSYMKAFQPLDARETQVIEQVQEALAKIEQIACTSCHYCTPQCPKKIMIPEMFSCMNRYLVYNELDAARHEMSWKTAAGGKASECISCGQCEQKCPQHLSIIKYLKDVADVLEVK